MTNLRENPYSLKDGDVVGVVDRLEDETGLADLSRADDEVSTLRVSALISFDFRKVLHFYPCFFATSRR